jgi:hypothetical protein
MLWNGRIIYLGVISRKERKIITISKFDCCRKEMRALLMSDFKSDSSAWYNWSVN